MHNPKAKKLNFEKKNHKNISIHIPKFNTHKALTFNSLLHISSSHQAFNSITSSSALEKNIFSDFYFSSHFTIFFRRQRSEQYEWMNWNWMLDKRCRKWNFNFATGMWVEGCYWGISVLVFEGFMDILDLGLLRFLFFRHDNVYKN